MSEQLAIAQQSSPPRFLKLDAAGNQVERDHVIVRDTATGLDWLVAYASPNELTHKAAEKAVAKLEVAGHSDWRLPTRFELESILDLGRFNPAINPDLFPGTKPDWHWTASPDASAPACAWIVSFYGGLVSLFRRDNLAWVRAVRVSRASQ